MLADYAALFGECSSGELRWLTFDDATDVKWSADSSHLCGMSLGPTNSQQIAWNVEDWYFVWPDESCPDQ